MKIELVERVVEPHSGGEEDIAVDDARLFAFEGEMVLVVPCAAAATEESCHLLR